MTTQEQKTIAYEEHKAHCQKVVDELIVLGHDAQVEKPDSGEMPSISVGGDTYMVKMRTYYAGNWARIASLKFVVDHYNASVNFRQKKDGTFNYKGIAKKTIERIKIAKARAKADAKEQTIIAASKTIVARLEEKYGTLVEGGGYLGAVRYDIEKVNVKFSPYYKDVVTLSISNSLTEDQAAQVIELVQSFKED